MKSESPEAAPRGRSGPPEMGAAAPAAEGKVAPTPSAPPAAAPLVQDESAALESEAGEAPSAETLADVAGDLAPSATLEAPAAPSDGPAAARQAPARPAALATIDATALSAGSVAQFENYLAEHQIEVDEARDAREESKLAPMLPPLATGETVLLVEASPAQVAAVYNALRDDRERFADVLIRDERLNGRDMRGGALAEGRTFAKAAERQAARDRQLSDVLAEATAREESPADAADKPATPGRAWRVGREGESAVADAYAARPGAPAEEAAEPLAAKTATGAAASRAARGVAEDDGGASAELVRVWFVLRAPQPAAAPSPAAARPE